MFRCWCILLRVSNQFAIIFFLMEKYLKVLRERMHIPLYTNECLDASKAHGGSVLA